jgi:hypothetical protein
LPARILLFIITTGYITPHVHLHMHVIHERLEQLAGLLSQFVAIGLVQRSIFAWQVPQVCYTAAQHLIEDA